MPKVSLAHYKGREQAYVKHCLLEEYLPDWAYKVGTKWDSLVYIDGFAGPWETKDPNYADSSFGVAIDSLRRCQIGLMENRGRQLQFESILVEERRGAFVKLQKFALDKSLPGFGVHPLSGEFVRQIPKINQLIASTTQNPFRFIFLDPKGWADIPMQKLRPFLRDRSCEVLITLMTRHIIRFLNETDREASYRELFGRPGVLEILRATPREKLVDQAVEEYSDSLRLLCGFKYVSSAVILEPDSESIRYFLLYATNHPRGVEVFKEAEIKAARIQDHVRHATRVEKTGQPSLNFDNESPTSPLTLRLRQSYLQRAHKRLLDLLSGNIRPAGFAYADLFCAVMAFPLVTPHDLVSWLEALEPTIRTVLAGSKQRRKPSPMEDDRIMVIDSEALCRLRT